MKISMAHPGTERSWEFGSVEVDAYSAKLRGDWLRASEEYRLAFLAACKTDPELDVLSDEIESLEADSNVKWHGDKAGQLGQDHEDKVARLSWVREQLYQRILANRALHQLRLAAHDAHAAHDTNWDARLVGLPRNTD